MTDKYVKWIFSITAGLVMFLFAAAFVLSYESLRALALANGIRPDLAWLWPLGLDAFMVCASLYMLWSHLVKEYEPLPLAIVMVSMCASVVFNVIHAPASDLARSVAALPPLVAFMAFEIMIIMVRHAVEHPVTGDAPVVEHDKPVEQPQLTPAARRAQLATIMRATPATPRAELAQQFGVSPTTINRDLLMLDTADVPGTTGGRNGR